MTVKQKVSVKTEDIIKGLFLFLFSFNSLVLFSEGCIDNSISIKKKKKKKPLG